MPKSDFPEVQQLMTRKDPRTVKRQNAKRVELIEPLGVYLGVSQDRKTPIQVADTREK